MTHFLLLFIVLFGGFLGWGLWELSEHYYRHAQRRFDRDWANAIRYNRRPWISITAMMEMMRKITERHFFPTEIGVDWAKPHQDSVDAMSFAMNTQQQFIRPWERIYVDEIAAFTDKQYKYLSDKMKP